jgi:hypothetical protein
LFIDILIDPIILKEKKQFKIQTSGPLARIRIDNNNNNDIGGATQESSIKKSKKESDIKSLLPLVILLDSRVENAGFIPLGQ